MPAGNLSRDVTIRLAREPIPATALPSGVAPHGRAYRVSASDDVFAAYTELGFILGLPVPEGVATGDLAIALADPAFDGEQAWHFLTGHYDSESRLLLTHTPVLLVDGDVVRLVSSVDFTSPTLEPPASGAATPAQELRCRGWFGAFEVTGVSGTQDTTLAIVEAHLEAALDVYRTHGFEPFALRTTGWIPYLSANQALFLATSCDNIAYTASVEIVARGYPKSAAYSPERQILVIYTPNAVIPEVRVAAFHELFHSLQTRYFGAAEAIRKDRGYFTEATATLAEGLAATPLNVYVLRSTSFQPRVVDLPLLTPIDNAVDAELPYEAQDFWLAIAKRFGLPFHTFMTPFLQAGDASPAKVDAVLRAAPFTSELAEQYAEWVVEQVFDLETCTFAADAVKALEQLGAVAVLDGETLGLFPARTESREELTTRVLQVTVDNFTQEEPFQLALRVQGGWAEMEKHSVAVVAHDVANARCRVHRAGDFNTDDAGAYLELDVERTKTDVLYVLLVNGDFASSRSGRVLLDPAPAFTAAPTSSVSWFTAETPTYVQFSLPFEDAGENVHDLGITVTLGDQVQNFSLDVKESELVTGFAGAAGTGFYRPDIVVYCSEKGKNPLTFTFQLIDTLRYESQQRSVSLNVDYGACP